MKFFRWILSHLMLLIVLSLIIYVYWNRNEIWPEEAPAEQTVTQLNEQTDKSPLTKQIENTGPDGALSLQAESSRNQDAKVQGIASEESEADQSDPNVNVIEGWNRSNAPSSSDFSERMKQYRETLPVNKQKIMDEAEVAFQQVSDGSVKYPDEIDIQAKPESPESPENIKQLTAVENDTSEQVAAAPVINNRQQTTDAVNEAVIIISEAETDDTQDNSFKETFEVVVSQLPSPASSGDNTQEAGAEENNTEGNSSAAQNKNLQQQIRSRQKQLQKQMVMLVPFNSESSPDKNSPDAKQGSSNNLKQLKPVKPELYTSQQRSLLKQARKAFDEQNFDQAEAKYLQIIELLPELPDTLGELANVYRTQNRTSEYLVTNTQFVERLVNHNRFNEAWKVVKVTDKLDKETADQQREIIKRKQED